jgi:hypothetical protein
MNISAYQSAIFPSSQLLQRVDNPFVSVSSVANKFSQIVSLRLL